MTVSFSSRGTVRGNILRKTTKHPSGWTEEDAHAVVGRSIAKGNLPESVRTLSQNALSLSKKAYNSGKNADHKKAEDAHRQASNQYRGIHVTAPEGSRIKTAANHLESRHAARANSHKWAANPANEIVAAEHNAWSNKQSNLGSYYSAKNNMTTKKSFSKGDEMTSDTALLRSYLAKSINHRDFMDEDLGKSMTPKNVSASGAVRGAKRAYKLGREADALSHRAMTSGDRLDHLSAGIAHERAEDAHVVFDSDEHHQRNAQTHHEMAELHYGLSRSAMKSMAQNPDSQMAKGLTLLANQDPSRELHIRASAAHVDAKVAMIKAGDQSSAVLHGEMAKAHLESNSRTVVDLFKAGKKIDSASEYNAKTRKMRQDPGYYGSPSQTKSGRSIPMPGDSHYENIDSHGHRMNYDFAAEANGKAMAHRFKGWTKQDHRDAADYHEDNNDHDIAGVHHYLSGYFGKVRKSMSKAAGNESGVVGRTRSNKPIYGGSHSIYSKVNKVQHNDEPHTKGRASIRDAIHSVIRQHGNYTAKDHADAAQFHGWSGNDHLAEVHQMAHGFLDAVSMDKQKGRGFGKVRKSMSKAQSHSGKRIGKTDSGKGVFSHAFPSDYKGFSASDHRDAAAAHLIHKESLDAKARQIHEKGPMPRGGSDKFVLLGDKSMRHEDMARLHSAAANELDKSMSKAGSDTVGRTDSGKPIYGKNHPAYKSIGNGNDKHNATVVQSSPYFRNYTKQDHHDAAEHHSELSHQRESRKHFNIAGAHYGAS